MLQEAGCNEQVLLAACEFRMQQKGWDMIRGGSVPEN